MGLDMYVEELGNTELLKKYSVEQLYQFGRVYEIKEELDINASIYNEILEKQLSKREIQQLMTDSPLFWHPMCDTPSEYVAYFSDKIKRLEGYLVELPSLPLEFLHYPPKLDTADSMYWRKANAIHGWFVKNIQHGVDDCGYYGIDYLAMTRLKQTVELILNEPNERKQQKLIHDYLPPIDGFYFGGVDIDEYYFECLEETLEWLENGIDWDALANEEIAYVYHSSW